MKINLILALLIFTKSGYGSASWQENQLSADSVQVLSIEEDFQDQNTYQSKVAFLAEQIQKAMQNRHPISEARSHHLLGTTYWAHAQYSEADHHLKQAVKKYRKLNLTAPMAECLNVLGLLQFYISNYPEAITYLDSALLNFKHLNDSANIARVMNNIGLVYEKTGDYETSTNYMVGAITYKVNYSALVDQSNSGVQHTELHNNAHVVGTLIAEVKEGMAKATNQDDLDAYVRGIAELGSLYQLIDKHDSAFYFLTKSAAIYDSTGRTAQYVLDMIGIADGYTEVGDLTKSKEVYKSLISRMQSERMIAVLGSVLEKLAKIELNLAQYDSAAWWYEKAVQLSDTVGHKAGFAKMKLGLAKAYYLNGEINLALTHALVAHTIAEKVNYFHGRKEAAYLLTKIYEALNNHKEALTHHKAYVEMALKQKNADAYRISKELEAKFELQEKSRQINKLDKQVVQKDQFIDQQLKYIGGLTIITIFLILLSYVVFRRNKEVRNLNTQIEKRNIENETLLKEVHHRVKNNLQMIISLLNMQQRRLKEEASIETLALTKSRIKSIGLIHEHLYQHDHLSSINLRIYANELCTILIDSLYKGLKEIKTVIEVEKLMVPMETAMPLGLILNELITNSIKHAFDKVDDPILKIQIKEGENKLTLIVSDNGNGSRDPTISNGFGSTIIEAILSNHDGEVSYEKTNEGFKVTITLQDYVVAR